MCLWFGNNRARTCDIMLVGHALYQLSYAPPVGRSSVIRGEGYYTKTVPDVNTKLVDFFSKSASPWDCWFFYRCDICHTAHSALWYSIPEERTAIHPLPERSCL